jgi:hypothetical protein|tara:strand:- start:288 stop:509 length:222 start_codon:yes stop_codon:yes gene_type:complete
MSLKESTSKKNYSNTHPKNKNIRVAKGPDDYEEDDRDVMEIMRDEYGTWDQHDADYYSKLKKKKLKKKKKKRA